MPGARHSALVPAPPEQVFAFIADGENAKAWRPAVLDVRRVSGDGLGATWAQGVRGPGGRRVAADYRVTTWDPPRRLAFEAIAGPVRPVGEYVLEPADGGTRVSFSLSATLGGLRGLLLGRAVQKTMDAEVRTIDNIGRAMGARS